MKNLFLLVALFLILGRTVAQEYRNLKVFQKETNLIDLPEGAWLKRDRQKNTKKWQEANKYNLLHENGLEKYRSISQIRDFYVWFDAERLQKGHEVKAAGIAGIVADQLSLLDNWWIRNFIITNQEVHRFANEGSQKVLQYAFPLLKEVYILPIKKEGEASKEWDYHYAKNEQCIALQSLYRSLSPRTIKTLDRMAKGKGIYCLGVPKALRFEGEVMNCQSRANHAMTKVAEYYENKEQ